MSITYSAGAGTVINTCASQGTTPTTDDDSNTITLDNTLANNNNGQIGTKFPTYVGRVVAWNSATYGWLYRLIVAESGTTNVACTVNEPWPGLGPPSVATYRVYYDIDDIETGGASGGIRINAKTGLYEFTNQVTLNSDAGLAINSGVGVELSDENNNPSFTFTGVTGDRHYLICGVPTGLGVENDFREKGVAGGVLTTVNATQAEPSISGNSAKLQGWYGTTFWSQRNLQTAQLGGDIADCIFIRCTDSLSINASQNIIRSQFLGNGTSIEEISISSGGAQESTRQFFGNTISSVPNINITGTTGTWQYYHTLAIPNSAIDIDVSGVVGTSSVFIDPKFDLNDITITGTSQIAQIAGADSLVVKVKDSATTPDLSGTKALQTQFLFTSQTVDRTNGIFVPTVANIDTDTDTIDVYSLNYYKQEGAISLSYTVLERDVRIGKYGRVPYIQRISTTDEPINLEITLEEDSLILESNASTADSTYKASRTETYNSVYWIVKSTSPSGTLAALDSFTDANSQQYQVVELISSDGSLVLAEAISGGAGAGGTFIAASGTLSRVGGGWSATTDSSQLIGLLVDGGGALSLQNVYDGIASDISFSGGGLTPNAQLVGFAGSTITHPMSKDGAAWIGQIGQANQYNSTGASNTFNAGAFYAYNTTDTSETSWKNVGAVTFPQTFSLSITELLGNSELRVYNNPSLLTGGGSSTELAGVETVAAATQTNTGASYIEYIANLSDEVIEISNNGTLQNDFTALGLSSGDKVRVVIRDNADNPTLQLFDEFEVNGTVTSSAIPVVPVLDSTLNFSSQLFGPNTKTVTIEKVNASETFNLASGTYDIVVFRKGSLPAYFLERELAANLSIPSKQVGDRVYNNPA